MRVIRLIKKCLVIIGSNKTKLKYARKQGVIIGDGCTILGRVEWGSEPYLIKIGNNVRITSGCQFVTHDGGVHVFRNMSDDMALPKADIFGRIIIGDNVFIGIRSIIMPGVTIGNNVVIGAGSIVTKNIPNNSVACGVPAKVVKTIDEYFQKVSDQMSLTKGMPFENKKMYLQNKFHLD